MNIPMTSLHSERLWGRIEALSKFTLPDVPWTRRAFSPLFAEARVWLQQQMRDAGLVVHQDAGGNLIGRREGSDSRLAPIITGSHCDTVVGGGRFDGIIGVLAGIEIAHALQDAGVVMRHPMEVIDFLSEEPSDYGASCIGSRAFSGLLDPAMLALCNEQGESLTQAMTRIGADPRALSAPLRGPNSTAAFVELHIEQGPVLEKRGLPIGVVTNIVGIRRVRITVLGQPDHAGTTPMDIRRDALVGAAEIIRIANQEASRLSGNPHYVVATIGKISMQPNVPNAVPGVVEMMMEVRSESPQLLDAFPELVMAAVQTTLTDLRLSAQMEHVSRSKPTDCQEVVMQAIEQASQTLGYPNMRMPSGAGHDAVYVAPTGPIGMIFIPCLNGRSHCPQESITPEQLMDGTRVMFETIRVLDLQLDRSSP